MLCPPAVLLRRFLFRSFPTFFSLMKNAATKARTKNTPLDPKTVMMIIWSLVSHHCHAASIQSIATPITIEITRVC